MRGLLGRVGLAVLSCAVALGVAEGVPRVAPRWSAAPTRDARFAFNPYGPDGRLGYALRPGARVRHVDRDFAVTVIVTRLGMRGPERTAGKPPGVRRILLLGDSVAFGLDVEHEETFGVRLERLLGERVGPVEVRRARRRRSGLPASRGGRSPRSPPTTCSGRWR